MKTTVKEITPQWAERILATRNPRNRPVSEAFVEKLARDIKSGHWMLTHQGIAFDENGDLFDGQHRLKAVVKAGRAVEMAVTNGIPASIKTNGITINTFETIDCGRSRSVSQMLFMSGVKNATRVAGAARSAVNFFSPRDWVALTTSQTKEVLHIFGGSVERIATLGHQGPLIVPRTPSLGVFSIWHTVAPAECEAFLSEVTQVTGAQQSQSRKLAKYLQRPVKGTFEDVRSLMFGTATAIWNHVNQRRVDNLVCNQTAVEWLRALNPQVQRSIQRLVSI